MHAIRSAGRASHRTYPLIDRVYNLRPLPKGVDIEEWALDLSYTEQDMAEYFLGRAWAPQQRVGVALELYDDAEAPVSPQRALQLIGLAQPMDLLSQVPTTIPIPVKVPGS